MVDKVFLFSFGVWVSVVYFCFVCSVGVFLCGVFWIMVERWGKGRERERARGRIDIKAFLVARSLKMPW